MLSRTRISPARLSPAGAATCLAAVSIGMSIGLGSAALAQDAGTADAGVHPDAAPEELAPDAGAPADPLPAGVGPITWAPGEGHDCHRYSKRRVCEGPRRVPVPSADALARQQELGLDRPRVAHRATSGPLPPEWVAAAPAGSADDQLLWPVQGGRLWRGYGIHRRLRRTKAGKLRQLRGRRRHEGVDIGAHEGTPILAADDGLVVYSDNGMSGYGNALILAHHDGSTTLYGHCRETYVAAGELVRRGQIIAAVGDTGLAHGAHLHFEWRTPEGRTRDPLPHLVGRPGRDAPAPEPPPEGAEEGEDAEDAPAAP